MIVLHRVRQALAAAEHRERKNLTYSEYRENETFRHRVRPDLTAAEHRGRKNLTCAEHVCKVSLTIKVTLKDLGEEY